MNAVTAQIVTSSPVAGEGTITSSGLVYPGRYFKVSTKGTPGHAFIEVSADDLSLSYTNRRGDVTPLTLVQFEKKWAEGYWNHNVRSAHATAAQINAALEADHATIEAELDTALDLTELEPSNWDAPQFTGCDTEIWNLVADGDFDDMEAEKAA